MCDLGRDGGGGEAKGGEGGRRGGEGAAEELGVRLGWEVGEGDGCGWSK